MGVEYFNNHPYFPCFGDFMPIYEYQCQSCGHEHEALQKMSAAPLINCPYCTKPTLKKKISASGFRLKGSGWYETDFKNGSKKNVVAESKTKTTDKNKTVSSCCTDSNCSK